MKMYSRVESITPARARALLANQVNQRPLNMSAVLDYTRQILEGLWKVTHQGIAITGAGKLLDGQHRLHAIVRANVTVTMLVTYNVEGAAFSVLDVQRKRTAADILGIAGCDVPRFSAAIAKVVIQIYKGTAAANNPCSNDEILAFVEENGKALQRTTGLAALQRQKATILGAVHFIFARIDAEKADAFLDAVKTGNNLSANNPAKRLRERLHNQVKGGRFASRDVLSWAILCANAYFMERSLTGIPLAGKTQHRFMVHGGVAQSLKAPKGIAITDERRKELANLGSPDEPLVQYAPKAATAGV
jgi:hypothetical protein